MSTFPIETNDAVAGETVLPGAGDGNDGPTGDAPKEESPIYHEHDRLGEDIDLDDGSGDAAILMYPHNWLVVASRGSISTVASLVSDASVA